MEDLESIFRKAHCELRPSTPVPDIRIEFFPFTGLNHTARLRENRIMIRVSDIVNDAPEEVYHSLAVILLGKLYRKPVDKVHHRTYRTFVMSEAIQQRTREIRLGRRRLRRISGSQGRYIDLNQIFDRLNAQYFAGALSKPQIAWSASRSRHVLGRFNVSQNAIFLSRLLDSPEVPLYVTEYLMFHEMLHMKYQSRTEDSRLMIHTPEFKAAEKQFIGYAQAKLWLKQL